MQFRNVAAFLIKHKHYGKTEFSAFLPLLYRISTLAYLQFLLFSHPASLVSYCRYSFQYLIFKVMLLHGTSYLSAGKHGVQTYSQRKISANVSRDGPGASFSLNIHGKTGWLSNSICCSVFASLFSQCWESVVAATQETCLLQLRRNFPHYQPSKASHCQVHWSTS